MVLVNSYIRKSYFAYKINVVNIIINCNFLQNYSRDYLKLVLTIRI